MEVLDSGHLNHKSATDFSLADKGLRLVNIVIDYMIILILLVLLNFIIQSIGITLDPTDTMSLYLGTWFVYLSYYFFSEHFFNGKTIGKFLTRTRAVSITNERMTTQSIVLRSISRLVPFEPFSFLLSKTGGWHDKWTDTMVIVE